MEEAHYQIACFDSFFLMFNAYISLHVKWIVILMGTTIL